MAIKDEQQRLNEEIANELDKYQVMLEYGRIWREVPAPTTVLKR